LPRRTAFQKEKIFYRDMLVMLALPAVMACYYHGLAALRLILICMASAVLLEISGAFLMRCPRDLRDLSALFIGAAIPLMLPVSIPARIAVTGVAFGILAVKLPLGGTFSAPFVPAAAGFAFISICWPAAVFSYPLAGTGGAVEGESLARMLSQGTSIRPNTINVFDILIGNVPGPMGAACIIVLLGSMAFMLLRNPRAIVNVLSFLGVCATMAALFPRIYGGLRLLSLMMELCSGLLVFAALFLLTDPATSPKKLYRRAMYGAMTAVICMLLRRFGRFEESVCFAVLISNAIWPQIERWLKRALKEHEKKRKEASVTDKEAVSDA